MQVAGQLNQAYRSLSKSITSILQNEGVRGFYNGVTPALFAASGSWGGYFLLYELSKERKLKNRPSGLKLGTTDHVNKSRMTALTEHCHTSFAIAQLSSGVEAGVGMVFLFNPVWVVKTRLALQGVDLQQKHTYTGPVGG